MQRQKTTGGSAWSRCARLALAAVFVVTAIPAQAAEPSTLPTIAVLPFEIQDTSGEVGPANRHDEMLSRLTTVVRDEITAGRLYRVVPAEKTAEAVAAINSGTFLRSCNGCELDIAKRALADDVLIGWIYKVSTLILTLHIEIKDASTGKTVYARVFDFRGDNERAYTHAAKTLVRSLKNELPARSGSSPVRADAAPRPIKITVFPFELNDRSAGGGIIAQDAIDTENLAKSTEDARRLLGASGRYVIVDAGSAVAEVNAAGGVLNCQGCEAAAAKKLGAEQSLAGIFTRVNRTEHTLQLVIRNAATGEIATNAFTGLRMGANYAWPRAVKWVMDHKILAPAQPAP